MSDNRAAWLDAVGSSFRVGPADMPQVGPEEILVKNSAIAINPIDWKVRDYGWLIKNWPAILGCDVAGIIVAVGSKVQRFKTGDRVIGHAVSLLSQEPKYGAFQHYVAIESGKAAILPDNLPFEKACVLPLAIDTSATGLFSASSDGYLGLDWPTLPAKKSDKTVVIYGASSSVGSLAVQFAAASGAYVIAIASARNFDYCRSCGADEVFDYKDESVVPNVVKAIQGAPHPHFAGIYDAISQPESYRITVPILEAIGHGNLATVLPGPEKIPVTSKSSYVEGINTMVHPLWEDYIGSALEQGVLKCVPEPYIIGDSLDSVEEGCKLNQQGISAKKVVITLT
ncbi:Dehydrogenase orsE [Fusarium oxysporum f. sp. cubense]|uniref:Dehydrogenase orsE n=1 Tax=Fusarium oxysporum f. sp. cubense TaxID=61366 RepID=A0A559LNL0_FUSOC|nr:Dehydrogenase orsE [Fusarium oxysporum f. sp. cubense]